MTTQTTPEAPRSPMLPHLYRVRENRPLTVDVFELLLSSQNGKPLPFAPGQFNMLYHFGAGEVPISFSGDPADPSHCVHTIRVVGTMTKLLSRLEPGDAIGLRGPYGNGWPTEECKGKDILLVAGGIGMAPLRPVLYQLLANREEGQRIILLYGSRVPKEVLYQEQLTQWQQQSGLELHLTVDGALPGWKGSVGFVTGLISQIDLQPQSTIAFLCGPEIMMRFGLRELVHRGMLPSQIYFSMERNMECAVGFCGHCQLGPEFICKDGPVFRADRLQPWLGKREI